MKSTRTLALILALSIPLTAAIAPAPVETKPNKTETFLWKASVAAFVASQAADIGSSLTSSGYEANPMLCGADGRFGRKAVLIKSAATVGIVLAERYVVRRWPKARKLFTIVNFGVASLNFQVTVHNIRLAEGR